MKKRCKELSGKIVRFTSDVGNEFDKGDIAVCLNGESGLFLGLSGRKFGRAYYESADFEIIEMFVPVIEDLLAEARYRYNNFKEEY
jgi:hypothetical protein